MYQQEFIPFALPDIGEEEIDQVVQTLRSGWLTSGPMVTQFEEEFRKYVGSQRAQAVNSCTAGLHVALKALDIGSGDEVITTPLTFCATVNVILQTGAQAVLADIGTDLNICPEAIERAITPNTRAIIPVHIAGLPCQMDVIWDIANRFGLRVIEDAAHACGAEYRGQRIGAGRSDAVAFSFYATKNLTTGEGGMVTSRDPEMHDRMRLLCLHGISRDAWRRYEKNGNWFYEVLDCGFKYNLSDVLAAIGIQQLRKLERMTARRIEIAQLYTNAFKEIPELELPPDRSDSRHCWHLYALRLNLDELSSSRAQFIADMGNLGIGCSVHFIPIPLHPYYKDRPDVRSSCPRAISEYERLVSIPLYSRMGDGEVERVIDAVKTAVSRSRKRVVTFATAAY